MINSSNASARCPTSRTEKPSGMTPARRAGRDNGVREAQSVCLLNALVDSGNRADFACQPDFTKGNEPLGECFAGFG